MEEPQKKELITQLIQVLESENGLAKFKELIDHRNQSFPDEAARKAFWSELSVMYGNQPFTIMSYLAGQIKHVNALEYLILNGARIKNPKIGFSLWGDIAADYQDMPIFQAARVGNTPAVVLLLAHNSENSYLCIPYDKPYPEVARLLIVDLFLKGKYFLIKTSPNSHSDMDNIIKAANFIFQAMVLSQGPTPESLFLIPNLLRRAVISDSALFNDISEKIDARDEIELQKNYRVRYKSSSISLQRTVCSMHMLWRRNPGTLVSGLDRPVLEMICGRVLTPCFSEYMRKIRETFVGRDKEFFMKLAKSPAGVADVCEKEIVQRKDSLEALLNLFEMINEEDENPLCYKESGWGPFKNSGYSKDSPLFKAVIESIKTKIILLLKEERGGPISAERESLMQVLGQLKSSSSGVDKAFLQSREAPRPK